MRILLVSVNSSSVPSTRRAEPRKRPRQERSRATFDRIVEAAARIFDERGYHSTTTNHVAEAAEVSVGSLYQYFPNKDALLVAIAERELDQAEAALAAGAAELRRSASDPATVFGALVAAAVDLNRGDHLHRVLRNAPRTAALDERLGRFIAGLRAEVEWHLLAFGLTPDLAARRAAVLVTAVDACVHELSSDDDAEVADLTDELVRWCLAMVPQ
jgi:AcrR family transcriptional regulator